MKRPRDALAAARRALARGELDHAEAECARALEQSADHPGAHSLAAAIAIARERWNEALAHAERAPEDPFVAFARARALLALGRIDEAHAALRRSRDLDPTDPALYELEATILRARGDAAGALHAAEGASALDPHRGSAYTLRAELLELLGRGDEALALLRDAVRRLGRDPAHHAAVLSHLAALLEARGEAEEAEAARGLAARIGAVRG